MLNYAVLLVTIKLFLTLYEVTSKVCLRHYVMTNHNLSSDHYNKNSSSFYHYDNSFVNSFRLFVQALSSSMQFNTELCKAFAEAYTMYFSEISKYNKSWHDPFELDKLLRSKFRKLFDQKFREEEFVHTLSDAVAKYSDLAEITGTGKMYQHLSNRLSEWNNDFLEPIRDTLYRTPSTKIAEIEKYSLFHYKEPLSSVAVANTNNIPNPPTHSSIQRSNQVINQQDSRERIPSFSTPSMPVLVIYAFINRHYILDLLPEVSVVRNLLNQGGLDIFATDWGTPSIYDKSLTIGHFVNSYIDKSVDLIRKITKSDKISLFGYCWGGDLALMYAALHPEKVRNLVAIATPGDFDLDNSLLSVWTRSVKEEYILDAFGNVPGMLLNSAFALRSPIEYGHKYFHFFEQPHGLESIAEFLATETWLYDSPPVIGEIYREFVEYCYKQNSLIKNKMRIVDTYNDTGKIVNLKNITMPFLNVVAQKDDLVAPASSKALNDALTESRDKSIIEFNSGHVGLMIGKNAHKELWPKVGEWIKNHS
jgi:polyhydroxyalkanoate synthase subunit PhaC